MHVQMDPLRLPHKHKLMLCACPSCPLAWAGVAQVGEVTGRIEVLAKKMGMPGYADKTPAEVKASDDEKRVKAEAELQAANDAITAMQALLAAS